MGLSDDLRTIDSVIERIKGLNDSDYGERLAELMKAKAELRKASAIQKFVDEFEDKRFHSY